MSDNFYVAFVAYLALQITAFMTLKGKWRFGAWVSAGLMAAAMFLMAMGLARGADLSPIYVVLALPVLITGLALLLLLSSLIKLKRKLHQSRL
ncbi:MAG TPA: hypothetical protein VEX38_07235 [Fimbriimonadaceae bacterium]|nr:hypothetical protein [Fimbriimonadaceae bacterium]